MASEDQFIRTAWDWTLGGRKVECKSSRLSWLPSVSTWFVNFRSVKFQEAGVRTHAPFDDLYLVVDTSDAVHNVKHDLRTAVQRQGKATAAHGHRVMVKNKRNIPINRSACEAILQKLCPFPVDWTDKGRCQSIPEY
ncbi:unnamed protein product [Symbiodinium sp. CCMP2592]|nr:unnamed protein product [Symbiodinium sp. CCMP2592]